MIWSLSSASWNQWKRRVMHTLPIYNNDIKCESNIYSTPDAVHYCVVCACVYPRPSSKLPVNWAKLDSRRKLRGDDGGDVSHLIVALSISTGDWKKSIKTAQIDHRSQHLSKGSLLANSLPLSCDASSSRSAVKQKETLYTQNFEEKKKPKNAVACLCVLSDQGHDS